MFTNDIRREPPKTYADLKEKNYTIYTTKSDHHVYAQNFEFINVAERLVTIIFLERMVF